MPPLVNLGLKILYFCVIMSLGVIVKQSGWLNPDERRDSAMYNLIGFILSILNEYNREIFEIIQYLCRKITAYLAQ